MFISRDTSNWFYFVFRRNYFCIVEFTGINYKKTLFIINKYFISLKV